MKWMDYRARLGIGFCDEEKESKVINVISNFMKDVFYDADRLCENYGNVIKDYYDIVGEKCENLSDDGVYRSLFSENNLKAVLSKTLAFLNCLAWHDVQARKLRYSIVRILKQWKIQYELIEDSDGIFIFPKGAPELDEALVSAPLEWLNDYPESHTAWIKALKEYADQTDENASDIADKFRKSLEIFLKEFFHTDKDMNELKRLYGNHLKSQGIPAEVQNGLDRILDCYDKFMNKYAKHSDRTSRKVLEYIMYETGNVMRLLITLKQEETSDAD